MKNKHYVSAVFILIWLAIVVFVSMHHEFWRDEGRALTIALEPDSVFGLPAALKNEGHPILWYLILRFLYPIFGTSTVLQIASVSIAFTAVTLLWFRSPFALWQKILFTFGYFPIFDYSVMCRNYGISMLLFFVFAALSTSAKKRPVAIAITLALLANTNAPACLMAFILFLYWIWNDYKTPTNSCISTKKQLVNYVIAIIIVITGFAAVSIALPNGESHIASNLNHLFNVKIIKTIFFITIQPSKYFDFWFNDHIPAYICDLLIFALFLSLYKKRSLLFAGFAGVAIMGLFFKYIYNGAPRHQGILYMFFITLSWISLHSQLQNTYKPSNKIKAKIFPGITNIIWVILLYSQISLGYEYTKLDINNEISPCKSFGQFLNSNPDYSDAIIIPEPGYYLEALPCYASNQIFLPRENKYAKKVMFTSEQNDNLELSELYNIAQEIKISTGKTVLLVIGHSGFPKNSEQKVAYNMIVYNMDFTWNAESLDKFINSTVKIAEYNNSIAEKFVVYKLK